MKKIFSSYLFLYTFCHSSCHAHASKAHSSLTLTTKINMGLISPTSDARWGTYVYANGVVPFIRLLLVANILQSKRSYKRPIAVFRLNKLTFSVKTVMGNFSDTLPTFEYRFFSQTLRILSIFNLYCW